MTTTFQDLTDDNWTELWDQLVDQTYSEYNLADYTGLPDSVEHCRQYRNFYDDLLSELGTGLPPEITDDDFMSFQREESEYWQDQLNYWNSKLVRFIDEENDELKEKLSIQNA